MYAGSNDPILWHFILKNWGKLHIFLKSSCLSKKKTEGTFLRKKFICHSLHRHFQYQHLLLDTMASLLG